MDWPDAPETVVEEWTEKFAEFDDAHLLRSLQDFPPLPDEDDVAWDSPEIWVEGAYRFEALVSLTCQRKLESAIPLILERMCYGDPGELMRGVCHSLEYAFAPEYDRLIPIYSSAANSERRGTRLWAITFLARHKSPSSRDVFSAALKDNDERVRKTAERGLKQVDATD